MARRFQPTLMDYVVIAINPALIMVLIGSLVYFLLEMFYQGQYPERLHFCLTLFIFAAVLIARISMEEGWDHAAPFGAALAVVICLAMHRFVSYEGRSFAALGWLINYALIGLTWCCAIQLTWDCTLIDETQDASGEGLLQAVGLDREGAENGVSAGEAAESKAEDEGRKTEEPNDTERKTSDRDFEDDMAWSTQSKATKKPAKSATKEKNEAGEKSWWDRFLERRRRPHAPGVWVVYFSLAALPIFGFGQAFIPVSNAGSRRYAFVLLGVYVATALGLLLTTSFLGLRRYLRQRRLEMPVAMAGTWLVTGAVLIVGLLVLTMLLPRPNAEYAISQMPLAAGSTERDSSQLAQGKEGTRDEQAKSGDGQRSRPENEKSESERQENGSGQDASHVNQSGKAVVEESKGGNGKSEDDQEGGSKSGKGQSEESRSSGSKNDQSKSDQVKSDESSSKRGAIAEKSNRSESNDSQGKSQGEPRQSQAEASQPPSTPTPPDLSGISDSLGAILKWVFYGAIVGIALWWSWKHRDQLLAWLQALLTGWRDLWGLLERREQKQKIVLAAPRHKSFYDYADPFASGTAGQYSPAELVRYSFEAFEAWARDQGWPRDTDQTAYEFARQVGGHVEEVAKPARVLADLYSRAAYANGTLPPSSADHLRALWETMRQKQPVGF
jgi:hypothetical protein